jgi:hypothetical protein
VAIFEGILKEMSGGTQQLSVNRADNAFVRHEYIQVGDQRIKSIRVLSYHNALLEKALGQQVKLSVFKGGGQYALVAMRLPDGTVERVDRGTVIGPMVMFGIQRIFAAAILVVIGLIVGGLTHATLVTVAFVALAAWLLFSWFRTWSGMFAARGAI